PTAVAGFAVMRGLARWEGWPEGASRPFDARRSGFVLGEGAGVLVLEAEEVARRRGAPVQAEVLGYGASADAHHITQPPPDGSGAQRAIRAALAAAGIEPSAVQHVNAHGTSTKQGDVAETRALGAGGEGLRGRGLEVRLGAADAVFLPAPGRATYRTVRALLRTAIGDAEGPRIRLTLVSLPGKSHVEVTAAFAVGRGTRVL